MFGHDHPREQAEAENPADEFELVGESILLGGVGEERSAAVTGAGEIPGVAGLFKPFEPPTMGEHTDRIAHLVRVGKVCETRRGRVPHLVPQGKVCETRRGRRASGDPGVLRPSHTLASGKSPRLKVRPPASTRRGRLCWAERQCAPPSHSRHFPY